MQKCFLLLMNTVCPSVITPTDWCNDSLLKDSGNFLPFQNLFCIAQLQKYSQIFLWIGYLFICEKDALIFVNRNMYLLDLKFL